MNATRTAWADGIITVAKDDTVLDAWFPSPALGAMHTEMMQVSPLLQSQQGRDDARDVELSAVTVQIDLDAAPTHTADVYLRLHLLSHRLVAPNSINLEGVFALLPTVAWTTAGPMLATGLSQRLGALKRNGITVVGLDKFPRMTDYVVPPDVRIADASRVRLGAHLAAGTTVMHEGFVNFNAGTLGPAMVEGRISQGVVVGAGSDIGGGASIMGTLSGGGQQRITIGERALLGANAGIGISIGNDCVVEAGLYVTAGTRVRYYPNTNDLSERIEVKAFELSGKPNLLFRRHSLSGAVEALPHAGSGITLNTALHGHKPHGQ
ncbi:MAG: 2,3,4,5-tetrahydropyridine-2,6-dicarboxylate N-succinyltransferase [Leucobacter sp.]|jgi:2,3,4,5-tetrahydropyridine-2-carboxylate N-succinyltransferase|nr:2,3,4,5-tetrahydropyridine-2,6-dicarboxylate N-succinyltransferase [Leucobacter sp.]